MTRGFLLLLTGGCLLVQGCARGVQPASAAQAPGPVAGGQAKLAMTATSECPADDLVLSFGGREGDFSGMSHDGALLTLKNTGKQICTVPKRPSLNFKDAAGKSLSLHVRIPPGMHPGPVMVPVRVPPGGTVQGRMRWVTGEVYDTNTCIDTAQATLTVRGGDVRSPFQAHICGPSPERLEYEQEFMQPERAPTAAATAD